MCSVLWVMQSVLQPSGPSEVVQKQPQTTRKCASMAVFQGEFIYKKMESGEPTGGSWLFPAVSPVVGTLWRLAQP